MAVIRSIDIMSLARIKAMFGSVIGLVCGCLVAAFGIPFGLEGTLPGLEMFSIAAIIVFPILFGIFALFTGAVAAFLYNIFAARVGGVQIELT